MRYPYEVAFKIASMDIEDPLYWLEVDLLNYLEYKGHYVYHRGGYHLPVIRSSNHKKAKYRWVLLVGHGLKRTLEKSELAGIQKNLRQARIEKEATYLVVGFAPEPGRVVILPAETALETGYVRSDKGGIDWIDL